MYIYIIVGYVGAFVDAEALSRFLYPGVSLILFIGSVAYFLLYVPVDE